MRRADLAALLAASTRVLEFLQRNYRDEDMPDLLPPLRAAVSAVTRSDAVDAVTVDAAPPMVPSARSVRYRWAEMPIGSSFTVDSWRRNPVTGSFTQWCQKTGTTDRRLVSRAIGGGRVRFWVLAREAPRE